MKRLNVDREKARAELPDLLRSWHQAREAEEALNLELAMAKEKTKEMQQALAEAIGLFPNARVVVGTVLVQLVHGVVQISRVEVIDGFSE